MLNFNNIKHIHFIGIGGISMSALAKLMLSYNIKVTGSDDHLTNITTELKNLGINIKCHHNLCNVKCCDLVIYTNAIHTNKDLELAKQLQKPIIERAEFLGIICNLYKNVIAICGTHGKTTTTAMINQIFEYKHPTTHIGGILNNINQNLVIGSKDIFITEACEYNKSFLHITPTICVINNIEPDHMDCYKNIQNLQQTFIKFAQQTQNKIVINHQYYNIIKPYIDNKKIITFDINNTLADLCATNIQQINGIYSFDCYYKQKYFSHISLNITGKHNIYNALASITTAIQYNIPTTTIQQQLFYFKNVNRRFEILYDKNIKIISDYAHHPTEIKSTIQTAKQLPHKKLICIFEPHTYSRTLYLFKEFTQSFQECDKLIILPTYSARENEIIGGTAFDLFKALPDNLNATYFKNIQDCYNYLLQTTQNNDIILWLGAGTIGQYAKEFTSLYKKEKLYHKK